MDKNMHWRCPVEITCKLVNPLEKISVDQQPPDYPAGIALTDYPRDAEYLLRLRQRVNALLAAPVH